jgi:hypothetical protein
MKVKLIFDLPEDESEMLIAVRSMDMVGSLRDFYERSRFLSDYWLTQGEIWSLCGLERYGRPVKLSTMAGNTC